MDDKRKLAKQGRNGDTRLAHLTPGEVVAPREAAPAVRGLLESAGYDPQRYTVGPGASKNPKTGLLEFWGDSGDGDSTGGESQGGRGRGGFSAKGGVSGADGVGRSGNDGGNDTGDAGLAAGREMMGMNTSPLGYGRFSGETVAGTLTRMANNMREAGYRNAGIADTMSNMGVGFGTRLATPGVPALGTFGRNALNTGGRIVGGMFGGVPGAIAGGLLGSALTGDVNDAGQQFGRNVVGALVNGVTQGVGPLGGMAANALANRAMDAAFSNPGPAQRNEKTAGTNESMFTANRQPSMPVQTMQMAQAPGMYNQNVNPVQFANVYDPLQRLRMRGLL